ncbi:hypothetical protein Gotur_017474, partial [Gossypium turneri]
MKDESEDRLESWKGMLGKRKQLGFEKARHKGGEIDIEAWVKEPARPTLKIGSESSISVQRAGTGFETPHHPNSYFPPAACCKSLRQEKHWSPMGWIEENMKSTHIRQIVSQAISLGMVISSALIIWKGLICITGSESPVVVVLSGSMEPGFKRGDILFLYMNKDPIRAGQIVVFND